MRIPPCTTFLRITPALILLAIPALILPADGDIITLHSPNQDISCTIDTDGGGNLQHSLRAFGHPVLEASPLGIVVDDIHLGSAVTGLQVLAELTTNQVFAVRGTCSMASNAYTEVALRALRTSTSDPSLDMVIRAYNTGLAYRYIVPGSGDRIVSDEDSKWQFPAETLLWLQRSAVVYEGFYEPKLVGSFEHNIGGPITAVLPDGAGYAAVTEAAVSNYSGMSLAGNTLDTVIKSRFLDDAQWTVSGGSPSPWRVTMAASNLNDLVRNTLVQHLSHPPSPVLFPDGPNAAWLQPGRALWSWWSEGMFGPVSNQTAYISAAAELGFEYCLLDLGWEDWVSGGTTGWSAYNLHAVLQSAVDSGVRIWVWKDWRELDTPPEREAFFDKLDGLNTNLAVRTIVGVKVDFMNSESVAMLDFYRAVSETAARRHFMLNFHGANKPTGDDRTYPNEMTREAVHGMEYNKWGPPDTWCTAQHNAALPFTRMLAGVADYTPGTFTPDRLNGTTFAHQIAMGILVPSPILHWIESPRQINAALPPGSIHREVFASIPSTWDESIALEGSAIGDLALVARRNGTTWYLGAVNGSATATRRLVGVDLSFTGNMRCTLSMLTDQGSPTNLASLHVEHYDILRDRLDLTLLPGGGAVVRIQPDPEPDSDADGLLDFEETGVYGTHPYKFDTDADGISDYAEIYCGSNPTNNAAMPPFRLSAGRGPFSVPIRFPTQTGMLYRAQLSTNLVEWNAGSQEFPGSGNMQTLRLRTDVGNARFLRVLRRESGP